MNFTPLLTIFKLIFWLAVIDAEEWRVDMAFGGGGDERNLAPSILALHS